MKLVAEDVLRTCPRCGAWPMAAKSMGMDRLTFRCPQCHEDQTQTLAQASRERWGVRGSSQGRGAT
jgi:tRNA(Ile2) C34 agmatinyltransferase TiaS